MLLKHLSKISRPARRAVGSRAGDDGASILAKAAPVLRRLRRLSVKGCRLGPSAANALADATSRGCRKAAPVWAGLRELFVDDNPRIGPAAAAALVAAAVSDRRRRPVRALGLSNVGLGHAGAAALARAVRGLSGRTS